MLPLQKTKQTFISAFSVQPTLSVQAPGRVNLIGEHTDYNDGFVLPCAIDYHTVITGSRRNDDKVRVIAVDYDGEEDEFSLDKPIQPRKNLLWANYVRGVTKYLIEAGYQLGGANLVISGNVPQGAGLSSSASLEVATGQFFKSLFDLSISPTEIARIGQRAENLFVGCNCGIMDQLISAQGKAGHALLIDCRSLETQAFSMPADLEVVIINSNVKRGLVGSEYNTRREQCEEAARFFGVKALRDVDLATLAEYIDWGPFFQTWDLAGAFPKILDDEVVGETARSVFADGKAMLEKLIAAQHTTPWISANAVFGLYPANAVGDDIEIYTDETRSQVAMTWHNLRQQHERPSGKPHQSLTDFVAERVEKGGTPDWIGAFAVTAGLGIEKKLAEFEATHDDYHAIMLKSLADRLAEACAEWLHREVRTNYWGYAAGETLYI